MTLKNNIQKIYSETPLHKKEKFLNVIKKEFEKHKNLRSEIREIAYEIISEKSEKTPQFASELKYFNQNDFVITKDITRFKTKSNKILGT